MGDAGQMVFNEHDLHQRAVILWSYGLCHDRESTTQKVYPAKVRCFLILIAGAIGAGASHAQNSPLSNIGAVRVVLAWTGATDTDKAAILSDTQLKLRQAGIVVLGPDENSVVNWPTLFIGIGAGTTAVPLI